MMIFIRLESLLLYLDLMSAYKEKLIKKTSSKMYCWIICCWWMFKTKESSWHIEASDSFLSLKRPEKSTATPWRL